MKSGKNKLAEPYTFRKTSGGSTYKRNFCSSAKSGDHKQENLVVGCLFFLTYFLIDVHNPYLSLLEDEKKWFGEYSNYLAFENISAEYEHVVFMFYVFTIGTYLSFIYANDVKNSLYGKYRELLENQIMKFKNYSFSRNELNYSFYVR